MLFTTGMECEVQEKQQVPLYPIFDGGLFYSFGGCRTKEEEEVKIDMDAGLFTTYVKELYDKTAYSAMGDG